MKQKKVQKAPLTCWFPNSVVAKTLHHASIVFFISVFDHTKQIIAKLSPNSSIHWTEWSLMSTWPNQPTLPDIIQAKLLN